MVDDRDKKTDYDFATAGESTPGRIATGYLSADNTQGSTTKKDKERNADATADLLRELNDARMQLCAQIDMFQALLDELYEERSIFDAQITALSNYLDDAKRKGEFDVGPDGYPIDLAVKNAIKAIEQKTGGTFNAHDTDTATDFIRLGLVELQNDRDGVNAEITVTTEKLDRSLEAFATLDGIEDRLNSGDYETSNFQHEILAIQDTLETKDQNTQQPEYEAKLDLGINLPSLN